MSIQKLKKDLLKKIDNQVEDRGVKWKGMFFSRGALDTLLLYVETYEREGNLYSLMPLNGDNKLLFESYGINVQEKSWFSY